MAAEAKALLDELMGRARNLDPSQQSDELSWSSTEVCKYFLCGFCPHELFTNTRADLGPCNKIHDEALRKEYQKNPRFERCGYEEDFIRYLQALIADVEKRIRRGHQRLALNSQQGMLNGGPPNPNEDKIKLLTEKISNLVQQAEELGCEGKVEEAQGVMKLADQLKDERRMLEMQYAQDGDLPMMKQMEVCEVCGAFLIVGDAPQRQDEHLVGKQHAGYAQVRAEVERRKQKAREELEAREANEAQLKQEREMREQERLREREERKQKEREREKEKERARDRRRRSRSRSKDRRRPRSGDSRRRRSSSRDRNRRRNQRSRSRDRRRRSRSSSKNKRSSRRSSSRDRKTTVRRSRERRSRSRNRSRSKDRKSRSNDKDRNNEIGRRKDDKDRESSKNSKPEIKSNTTIEERHLDSHDRSEMDRASSGEDRTAASGDAISHDEKKVEDVCKMLEAEHEPSCMDTVVDGHSITEGDTKIDA